MRLEPHPGLALSPPFLSRLTDIGAIAFARQKGFFKAIVVANKPAGDRGGIGPRAALRFKRARQFGHRNVVLLRHPPQQKNAIRIKLGVPASANRLGRQAASRAVRRHQVDDKLWRNVEMRRGGAPRVAATDKGHNTLAKIPRISSRHPKSPPRGNEITNPVAGNPSRFNLTIRRSSVDSSSAAAPFADGVRADRPGGLSASVRNAAGNLRHDLPHHQPFQAGCHDGCGSTIQSRPSRLAQKVLELGNRNGQDCDSAFAEHAARRHCGIDARNRAVACRRAKLLVSGCRSAPNPSQVSS